MGFQAGSACFCASTANPMVGEWELAIAPIISAMGSLRGTVCDLSLVADDTLIALGREDEAIK